MGLDRRIGTKFLHAGAGYGGSCFPKDTLALTHIADKAGYRFRILEAVVEVNRLQQMRMVEKAKGLSAQVFVEPTDIPNTSRSNSPLSPESATMSRR